MDTDAIIAEALREAPPKRKRTRADRIMRMQYAHPSRVRYPAEAKPQRPFQVRDGLGNIHIVNPPRLGGERSKYTPHQGEREQARRRRQMDAQ